MTPTEAAIQLIWSQHAKITGARCSLRETPRGYVLRVTRRGTRWQSPVLDFGYCTVDDLAREIRAGLAAVGAVRHSQRMPIALSALIGLAGFAVLRITTSSAGLSVGCVLIALAALTFALAEREVW